jgi:uncharacterized membrane protein
MSPVTSVDPRTIVLPSLDDDPVGARANAALGGPVGRHARLGAHGFWTPLRVLLVFAFLTAGLAWAQKAACRDPFSWQHEHQYTRLCYSDVTALYYAEGLNTGQTPYVDHPVEYPVVVGGVMWFASEVARSMPFVPARHEAEAFFDITALILAAGLLLVVVMTAKVARRRPWDAAMVALAPAMVVHAYTNWDLVAAAFLALAIHAWSREHPEWAGFWIALGTASKLYPAFVLVPLLGLCLRSGQLRAWARTVVAAVATFAAVNIPVYLAAGTFDPVTGKLDPNGQNAWLRFWSLNRHRPADWDSLWFLIQRNRSSATKPFNWSEHTLNLGVAVLVVLVFALILVIALTAPRRPRFPQLAFLTVAGFLLVNKVDSPQYVVWLIPLAVLARPRWRAFLVWQATELVVLATRFYFFVGNDKPGQGIGYRGFGMAVVARDIALLVVMGLVLRDIYRPELDVVRRDGEDDPAGGVLDQAPDTILLGK